MSTYKNLILSHNPILYWKLDSYIDDTYLGVPYYRFQDEISYRDGMSYQITDPLHDSLVLSDSGYSLISYMLMGIVVIENQVGTYNINPVSWVIPNYASSLQPFTLEAWIKPTEYPSAGKVDLIMGHHTTTGVTNSGVSVVLNSDGSINAGICVPCGGVGSLVTMLPNPDFLNNIWHIVFAKRSNTTTELWINGISQGTGTHVSPAGTATSAFYLFKSSLYNGFHGYGDEVAVYDYALDEATVQEHYNVGSTAVSPPDIVTPSGLSVYGEYERITGGKWYYSQNKPGSRWYDTVDNSKGWTVDMGLQVVDINNSSALSTNEPPNGMGLYINDGTRQESIYFFQQEIYFTNAKEKVLYDATQLSDYFVVGKGDNLKLFARPDGQTSWQELANVGFYNSATNEGNAGRPRVSQSLSGELHAVWHDDVAVSSHIYYSSFTNEWKNPVPIVKNSYGASNPDIVIDESSNVYVVYESKEIDYTNVVFIEKTSLGWSNEELLTTETGESIHPKIILDSLGNLHVVWEDHRSGNPEIFSIKRDAFTLKWSEPRKLYVSEYGSLRPAISSYLDNIFVSWTEKESNGLSKILVLSFDANTLVSTDVLTVPSSYQRADNSCIIANMGGRVFVCWKDENNQLNNIYLRVIIKTYDPSDMSLRLVCQSAMMLVVIGNGGANNPVMTENMSNGDIYIVWEDYYDPETDSNEPYIATTFGQRKTLFLAWYNNKEEILYSSGQGNDDTKVIFDDMRSCTFPSVPHGFSNEISVMYQMTSQYENDWLYTADRFERIGYFSCDISHTNEFHVTDIVDYGIRNDWIISRILEGKEIRFGDFSNTLTGQFLFTHLKYYTSDAVEPLTIKEVSSDQFRIGALDAFDSAVSNAGDAWIVGPCGVLFFSNFNETIFLVGSQTEVNDMEAAVVGPEEGIRTIAFDRNNVMFLGCKTGLYYSVNHFDSFYKLSGPPNNITAIAFDKNNRLLLGTDDQGIKSYTVNSDGNTITLTEQTDFTINLPNMFISKIKVDDNNVVWVGTKGGLVRYYNLVSIIFTISDGLPSNVINDIAIKDISTRFIATSNGVAKMSGSYFINFSSWDDNLYNNNVKSVVWKDPNILWAGTMSRISQIIFDDTAESVSVKYYEPSEYSRVAQSYDDLMTFYIVMDDSTQTIDEDSVVEVYLNGNRLSHGYKVAPSPINIVRFETNIKATDVVDVVVRNNLKIMTSFVQSDKEREILGKNTIRVKDMGVTSIINGNIYAATEGDENELKVNDSNSNLPFDSVHFDITPPTGSITIGKQLNRSLVEVDLTADDGVFGSGVESMIISNYSNFTSDGTVTQSAIPFASNANHDLGFSTENVADQYSFTSGNGSTVYFFNENVNYLWAGTSFPSRLYQYSFAEQEWKLVVTYGDDDYVDFIINYNNKLVVSVGSDRDFSKIYVYDLSSSSIDVLSFSLYVFEESRAYCYRELNGTLYIGTGIGTGDVYGTKKGDSGHLWSFDGQIVSSLVGGLGEDVYSLSSVNDTLYAATGTYGSVYEINPIDKSSIMIHKENNALISSDSIEFNGKQLLFFGGDNTGTILRTYADSYSFYRSFQTVASNVSVLKTFINSDGTYTIYAVVGRALYYLSDAGNWTWRYTHNENINDITWDLNTEVIYVISNNKITKIEPITTSKNVYLQLIDRAGNKSLLYDSEGNIIQDMFGSISISLLIGFVNENKVFELDENGNVVYSLNSDKKFYSGSRIEEEKGVYESEIFDGTNDLVRWDTISWQVTELDNTSVLMYVRGSSSKTDILLEEWVGPYTTVNSGGLDISSFGYKYFQFKVELISQQKNISPLFHRASIRVITKEAVHFFTTNFILPSSVRKGLLTSEKITPIAADIVFGINSSNSVDFADYQIVDENRLFNNNQSGENLRVGIKLISPSRSVLEPVDYGEYGPYRSDLYINTVDFDFVNSSGSTRNYYFEVEFYQDVSLNNLVYSLSTEGTQGGFNIDGQSPAATGHVMASGDTASVFLAVSGSINLRCNIYYYPRTRAYYYDGLGNKIYSLISDSHSFIAACGTSFVDTVLFDFENSTSLQQTYNFRIKFYTDPERTNEHLVVYSGNDITGWSVNGSAMSISGSTISPGGSVEVSYVPDSSLFTPLTTYYLIIDAFDGTEFIPGSFSYTFQSRDVTSLEYCGPYTDVPIVKNFALMVELVNSELIRINAGEAGVDRTLGIQII